MADEKKVLGETYEPGEPERKPSGWRKIAGDREEKLKYLQAADRYWYAKEGYGSEKRKTPA